MNYRMLVCGHSVPSGRELGPNTKCKTLRVPCCAFGDLSSNSDRMSNPPPFSTSQITSADFEFSSRCEPGTTRKAPFLSSLCPMDSDDQK